VKNILLAGIAFLALVAPAAAADMPVKALPPAPIDIWTGGYVGANVGYDWGSDDVKSVGSPGSCSTFLVIGGCSIAPNINYVSTIQAQAASFVASPRHDGFIYGGQAGHNFLLHNLFWSYDGVLGVEVDFQGKSDSHTTSYTSNTPMPAFPANTIAQTVNLSEKIDTLGTLRGRAGWLWTPNTLIYATAGVAWAHVQGTASFTQSVTGVCGACSFFAGAGGVNTELFGPVIGAGVEWKWTANWSVKAEYLYADLGNATFNTGPIYTTAGAGILGQATANVNTHVHDNIARVGVNYRFW
jgi:outer membrane immunogenic protein